MDNILEEFVDNVQKWKRVEDKMVTLLQFVSNGKFKPPFLTIEKNQINFHDNPNPQHQNYQENLNPKTTINKFLLEDVTQVAQPHEQLIGPLRSKFEGYNLKDNEDTVIKDSQMAEKKK